jgi:nucleoside-diphosphate-sugar epimerase
MAVRQPVLIVGVSGTIGSRLGVQLRQKDIEVIGVARFSKKGSRKPLDKAGIKTIVHDILHDDPADLPPASTVVFEVWNHRHHADLATHDAIWDLNYHAVGRIVARYAAEGAVFINGCSGNVYGVGPEPKKESDPPRPVTEYGLSRMAQETLIDFLCRQHNTRAVHLRYYNANTTDSGLVYQMARTIRDGKSLGPNPDMLTQIIALDDFTRCSMIAMRGLDSLPRAINICHPRIWTMRELAERLRKLLDTGRVKFDCDKGGRELSVIGDPTLMLERFGLPTVSVEDMLGEICQAVQKE